MSHPDNPPGQPPVLTYRNPRNGRHHWTPDCPRVLGARIEPVEWPNAQAFARELYTEDGTSRYACIGCVTEPLTIALAHTQPRTFVIAYALTGPDWSPIERGRSDNTLRRFADACTLPLFSHDGATHAYGHIGAAAVPIGGHGQFGIWNLHTGGDHNQVIGWLDWLRDANNALPPDPRGYARHVTPEQWQAWDRITTQN
jgi:hypothetical protein